MKLLTINGVNIHCIKISTEISRINFYKKLLSKDEITKANKFKTRELVNNYVICRGALRDILGEYQNYKPKELIFDYNNFGKPEIKKSLNNENLCFNVSHSGDYCLIAVTNDTEVGIDIEEKKMFKDFYSMAFRFFSKLEYKHINNINDFYDIWSQKEALIKATGQGLSFGLKHWNTKLKESNYDVEIDSKKFRIINLNINDQYSSALCISYF